jgi:hypothetical protein
MENASLVERECYKLAIVVTILNDKNKMTTKKTQGFPRNKKNTR